MEAPAFAPGFLFDQRRSRPKRSRAIIVPMIERMT
jgi:hypothetical protein